MTEQALDKAEHNRDLYLRRTYNITLKEYKGILSAQSHKCPVCLKELSGISHPVDHDHKTGVVRGILCTYCNHRVVGRHRVWEILWRASMYLQNNPARHVVGHRQVPPRKSKLRNSATRAKRT